MLRILILMMFTIMQKTLVRSLVSKPNKLHIRHITKSKASDSNQIVDEKRLSSAGLSLDTSLIAEHPDVVISHLKARKASAKLVDDVRRISELRTQRNSLIVEGDAARSARKNLSQQIGKLMRENPTSSEVEALKAQADEANDRADKADSQQQLIDSEMSSLFSLFPNLLDDRVPQGLDDSQNVEVTNWGSEKRLLGDGLLWHDEIAQKLGCLNVEAAARISGARFSVLLGSVSRLERALVSYFLDFHTSRGYTEVSVPYIVSRSTLEGTGQLPKFEEDLFKVSHSVAGEDAFLIPTAEVPVTNLYRDQLLDASQLPILHVSHTPCFRAEAGSYGRDTRGLLRQHQFQKVELVKICSAETSAEEHEKMAADSEALLQALGLPYRKVMLCSGDTGFSAHICYDLEVWLPGQQMYREIASISNCKDFQARRMSLRYRVVPSGVEKKPKRTTAYPHTINGSGLAVGRTLVAVLENYQQPDGSVIIPDVLKPYMGGIEKLVPVPK